MHYGLRRQLTPCGTHKLQGSPAADLVGERSLCGQFPEAPLHGCFLGEESASSNSESGDCGLRVVPEHDICRRHHFNVGAYSLEIVWEGPADGGRFTVDEGSIETMPVTSTTETSFFASGWTPFSHLSFRPVDTAERDVPDPQVDGPCICHGLRFGDWPCRFGRRWGC